MNDENAAVKRGNELIGAEALAAMLAGMDAHDPGHTIFSQTESPGDYQRAVLACWLIAKMVDTIPLDWILKAIAESNTTGPIVDPTLWRRQASKLEEDEQIVRACKVVADTFAKLRERAKV